MTKLDKYTTNDLGKQALLVEINRLRAENERLRALVQELPDLLERLAEQALSHDFWQITRRRWDADAAHTIAARIREHCNQ